MNGLHLLVALLVGIAAYEVNRLRLARNAARQEARHQSRLREIAEHQRDAARSERDEAVEFADEASLLLALDRHPAGTSRRHLAVVVDR